METQTRLKESNFQRITHDSGAEVTAALHGGHAVSWKTPDSKERLFLSERAEFTDGKAIRGGIPVIFPQFSDHGPFGRHGFARKTAWTIDKETDTFELLSSPATQEEWPHDFLLSLDFQLTPSSLEARLLVVNPGDEPFSFHAALHTYLKVADVTTVSVAGLENCPYLDEVDQTVKCQDHHPIKFGHEIDRAYHGAGEKPVELRAGNEILRVESKNFRDVVVWNPGPDHGISDLGADEWKQFVCLESAQVENQVTLEPGETWRGRQVITIFSES